VSTLLPLYLPSRSEYRGKKRGQYNAFFHTDFEGGKGGGGHQLLIFRLSARDENTEGERKSGPPTAVPCAQHGWKNGGGGRGGRCPARRDVEKKEEPPNLSLAIKVTT